METEVRDLIGCIRTKFPRELRDIIYSFVWDKHTVRALRLPPLLQPCHRHNACLGQSCSCRNLPIGIPFIAQKDIVGRDIAAEAIDWLYRHSLEFEIGSPEQLLDFFTRDLFGVRVIQKNYALPKLKMHLGIRSCSPSVPFNFFFSPILAGKIRDGFMLELHYQPFFTQESQLLQPAFLCPELKPAIDHLRQKGIPVKVICDGPYTMWDITDLNGY
ncbi:hypothetical protein BKA66DRAFT_573801 [Pyrenochaeta sp. MPI-SDFR-AT-0127]|nr:hypothetical protein BKA66DRAFT_573801 [Pyrenochaeta sp. MPI-SDFR-AT-0127]